MAPHISPTPEKLSYALVAHKGNGGKVYHHEHTLVAGNLTDMGTQIAQVDGLYMSSELATKVKHSDSKSFTVQKAQLRDTQASLAKIKYRHVFRLMDLPEEVRRIILIMLVRGQCDLGSFYYDRPAIAAAGNEQLRLEVILAALQNNALDATWQCKLTTKWLETVGFDALQKAGMTCPRDGFSAIRAVDIRRRSDWTRGDQLTTRLLGRLENLRDLRVVCNDATRMFEIGSEYGISGDALGAEVRQCNLDLPWLDLPNLRKLTVVMRLDTVTREEWMRNVASYVPDWRERIEDGCKKVAGWLSEEYSALGLKVTVVIQTELDEW
jgi:hypothetical protein